MWSSRDKKVAHLSLVSKSEDDVCAVPVGLSVAYSGNFRGHALAPASDSPSTNQEQGICQRQVGLRSAERARSANIGCCHADNL